MNFNSIFSPAFPVLIANFSVVLLQILCKTTHKYIQNIKTKNLKAVWNFVWSLLVSFLSSLSSLHPFFSSFFVFVYVVTRSFMITKYCLKKVSIEYLTHTHSRNRFHQAGYKCIEVKTQRATGSKWSRQAFLMEYFLLCFTHSKPSRRSFYFAFLHA